jgi:hypothetical protein
MKPDAALVMRHPASYAACDVKPIVNLEETPGKVVGRVRPIRYDSLVDLAEGLLPRLPYPKGVYRFRTFEAADAWKNQHLLQAALTRSRARRA